MTPNDFFAEAKPLKDEDVKNLWPQAAGELSAFANHLAKKGMTITASQIIMAVGLANEAFKVEDCIKVMELRLTKIIRDEGYQEMADGFDQALKMVRDCFAKKEVVDKCHLCYGTGWCREGSGELIEIFLCPVCKPPEDIKQLKAEIERLKRGDFTPEELQNLCHNMKPDDFRKFKQGCEDYTAKLFGFKKPNNEDERQQLKVQYDGKTEPCCECGEDYPRGDLVIDGEIYCSKCRDKENLKPKW